MTGPYAIAVMVVALVLAAWTAGRLVRNVPVGRAELVGTGLLTVMLLGFLVGGVVQMLGTDRVFARGEFVIYLVATALVPPLAFWWALGEKSRAGTAVLLVAFLITPVLVLRIQQVWAGV